MLARGSLGFGPTCHLLLARRLKFCWGYPLHHLFTYHAKVKPIKIYGELQKAESKERGLIVREMTWRRITYGAEGKGAGPSRFSFCFLYLKISKNLTRGQRH